MQRVIGRVLCVYIPKEQNPQGKIIEVMNSKKVGFKVQVDNIIVDVVQEQNEFNTKIFKDDLVLIAKQTISGIDFTDIELYDGDKYE